jgi:hypothetical protein
VAKFYESEVMKYSSSEDFMKLESTKPTYLSYVEQAKEIICLENLGVPFLWETFGHSVDLTPPAQAVRLSLV